MNNERDSITGEKARILLLAGFLGSGKTTLLKRILSWEADLSDTVVLVNEFGDIGIDGALLKDSGSDVVELTSGCICCTLSADLQRSLEKIYKQFSPRRILIESSGLADPTAVTTVLDRGRLGDYLVLQKIITVLDADLWEARENFGPLFFNQLEMANVILLNKIDLLAEDQVARQLEEIHSEMPGSHVVPTIHCRIDPETLWTENTPKAPDIKPMSFYLNHEKRKSVDASGYVTFVFESVEPLDENCFKQFISELPFEMFRMKGPVRFEDRTVMINFVGGRGDEFPWDDSSKTQLAFIGWNVDPDKTLKKINDCLVR